MDFYYPRWFFLLSLDLCNQIRNVHIPWKNDENEGAWKNISHFLFKVENKLGCVCFHFQLLESIITVGITKKKKKNFIVKEQNKEFSLTIHIKCRNNCKADLHLRRLNLINHVLKSCKKNSQYTHNCSGKSRRL